MVWHGCGALSVVKLVMLTCVRRCSEALELRQSWDFTLFVPRKPSAEADIIILKVRTSRCLKAASITALAIDERAPRAQCW